jgi:hypothetical protein
MFPARRHPAKPQAAIAPRFPRPVRRWPLVVIAVPASVAIWAGWVSLAEMCGFGLVEPFPGITPWRLNTAITLPVGVEAFAAYAMSAWLSPASPQNARTFAKWSALGSLALGMLGQVAYHLLSAAHRTRAPWPVVIVVACLPVITLGFSAALAHLLHADATTSAATVLAYTAPTAEREETEEKPTVRKPPLLPADLIMQARALDARHRLAHRGKPISRDKLKVTLGIATDKATALTRIIRVQHEAPRSTGPGDEQAAGLPSAALPRRLRLPSRVPEELTHFMLNDSARLHRTASPSTLHAGRGRCGRNVPPHRVSLRLAGLPWCSSELAPPATQDQ